MKKNRPIVGRTHAKRGGYTLLLSILFVGSIASVILTSILMLGTNAGQVGLTVQQSSQALALVQACSEYAMQQLRTSLSYGGNEVRTLDTGRCEILQITGIGNNNRVVCIEGVAGDVTRRLEIVVSQVLPATKIDSWQEVTMFTLCE